MRPEPAARRSDDGFTLVEVIVALALMSVVATAALYFFLGGTRAVTHQQRSQNAVVVANEAMELAYSAAAKADGNGTSGLVKGRSQSQVTAAWTALASKGIEGYSTTYPAWDPAGAGTQAVDITRHTKLSGVDYAVTTLIGTCYRSTATASAPCSIIGQNPPSSTPAGYARLMRVMTYVTWDDAGNTCGSGGCSYQVSSLIDPNSDLTWNNTTKPIAVDDVALVNVGQSVDIDVLSNDIIGVLVSNPVRNLTVAKGTGTVTLLSSGKVRFTAPTTASGKMTFTYSLKDQAGRESNVATVTVSVYGQAMPDSASTIKTRPITIGVGANDRGTPATIQITSPPAKGTATPSGSSVVYDPGNNIGTFTFEYQFTDADGLPSSTTTVTVVVSDWPPPQAANLTVDVPATVLGSTLDLGMLTKTNNPEGYLVEILSSNMSQGRLVVDGRDYNAQTNRKGGTVGYTQQGNVLGIWTFQYRVLTPDSSQWTATRTVTLRIMPVAAADTFKADRNSTVSLNIGANDAPMNYGGTVGLSPIRSNPSCGSFPAAQNDFQNGIVSFRTPDQSKFTCTFTYTLQGTGAYAELKSNSVSVTVTNK